MYSSHSYSHNKCYPLHTGIIPRLPAPQANEPGDLKGIDELENTAKQNTARTLCIMPEVYIDLAWQMTNAYALHSINANARYV